MTDLIEEARTKKIAPVPSKNPGQRSLQYNAPFLFRYPVQWRQPDWLGAEKWRAFVQSQPVAVDCREAIINYILSLDWKIVPRDSTKLDELKPTIDYYTNFLTYTGEYEFSDLIEWLLKDYLDLPFGGAAEVGREGDSPNGRVRWIELLDGGTLFPTDNVNYPIGQALPSDVQQPIYFPKHAINRIYMSPRTEIMRKGWGMAPPEKIYLAIDLISKGDKYYVNLLSDTPEAGLLDLLNMSKESAEQWIEAFKAYMAGVDPFKIPVLYEHDQPAKWIPFGRPPTELMYDRTILKYAAIVCAGYGLTLSDIGFASSTSGGDTLAGSIRQERKSKRQGISKAKKRLESWVNRVIDPQQNKIRFVWLDMDDEFAIAQGRARLANATAFSQYIEKNIITPEEARMQAVADGTFTVSMPEAIPESKILEEKRKRFEEQQQQMKSPERPGMLGKPVSPSQGGHGEVLPRSMFENQLQKLINVDKLHLQRLALATISSLSMGVNQALDELDVNELGLWDEWQRKIIWEDINDDVPEMTNAVLAMSVRELDKSMEKLNWWEVFSDCDEIADEILELFRVAQADAAYTRSEIDSIEDYQIHKSTYKRLHKSIVNEIENLNVGLKGQVQKAVQAGITTYLAGYGKKLDETLKIDDNLINCIRSQLIFLSDRIIIDFGKKLEKLMEK